MNYDDVVCGVGPHYLGSELGSPSLQTCFQQNKAKRFQTRKQRASIPTGKLVWLAHYCKPQGNALQTLSAYMYG